MTDLTYSVQAGVLKRNGRPDITLGGGSDTVLLSTSFDAFTPASPMPIADFRTAMGTTSGGNSTTVAHTSVVTAGVRGNVLRQHFLAGQIGGASGITYFAPLSTPLDEAMIQYDVRFVGSGFDWGWGGKLPGLGGISPSQAAGSNPPTGGSPSPYGWSGRGMWITPGSYGSSAVPDEWIGYIYDPTQSAGNYGVNRRTGKAFAANQWYTVKQYYKMNTIAVEGSTGNADGVHKMWLDGVLVYSNTTQVFKIYDDAKITHMLWHQFYGGATTDWAPSVDTDIDFDNILITTPGI